MGLTIKDIDVGALSPMMQHYVKTKEEYKDSILFYRLGDFYARHRYRNFRAIIPT